MTICKKNKCKQIHCQFTLQLIKRINELIGEQLKNIDDFKTLNKNYKELKTNYTKLNNKYTKLLKTQNTFNEKTYEENIFKFWKDK